MARNPTHLGSMQWLYLSLTPGSQPESPSSICLFLPISVISEYLCPEQELDQN